MAITQDSIRKTAGDGRDFGNRPPIRQSNGENSSTFEKSSSETFTQRPEDHSAVDTDFHFDQKGAIWYPDDLGSSPNAYYVKFEVYLLDTEKSTSKVRGDSPREVGFDDGFKPRFTQGLGTSAGHTRNLDVKIPLPIPTMKRVNEIIAMPMPDSVVSDHAASWSRAEGGMISNILALGDGVVTNGLAGGEGIAKTAALGAANGLTGLISQLGADGAQTHLKLLTKRAANPRNEFLFDGVNNRSFNFQWKFIPRSPKEARTLKGIIEKFKLYMYPELDQSTAGNFYLFPAMFDITFMQGNKENEWLYRTSTCALTNMIVNHTPAGQWIGMDSTGAPLGYDITLQFVESEFLHRDRFKSISNPNGVAR